MIMALVLYDMLLNLKYPIPEKDVVVYGKEGGEHCDIIIGSNKYDEMRSIDDEEKIVMNFVLGSVSHEHFVIDRRGVNASGEGMVVKDLSRNGTFVSLEGGEYEKADRVADGNYDAVRGRPIQLGSRIRLGASSDHILEIMTDDAASGLILVFQSVRESMDEEPQKEKPKKKKKKGLFGLFGR
jgi:hypothetical protein